MHAPAIQGCRNEVKVFNIQAVSDMVHIMSEACRSTHALRTQRKHMHINLSLCWGVWSMSVCVSVGRGRWACTSVCTLSVSVYVGV